LHRDFIPGVAQLGLWRRSFGKPLAIALLAVHTFYSFNTVHTLHTNNANGVIAGDYAGLDVDWPGKHAAICCDGSTF
jgi:hypothetical protein